MVAENEEVEYKLGDRLAGRYLSFLLSGEEYCVEIEKVRQIIQIEEITFVPMTPPHIKGVINLRGKVVPVVDLRMKFDMEIRDNTDKTCIIVLQIGSGESQFTVGVIIDEVNEVVQIKAKQIEEVPSFGNGIDVTFLMGIAKFDENVRMIVDIETLFSLEELKKNFEI